MIDDGLMFVLLHPVTALAICWGLSAALALAAWLLKRRTT